MANRFTQTFTLLDIFNNKKLEGKVPLINYKETEKDNGNVSATTSMKTISKLVYDTSVKTARPYYKPLIASKSGDYISIGGTLVETQGEVVEAIYNALMGTRVLMIWTANNMDMVRSAIKEGSKNKRTYGLNSKLYLRVQSMQEIEVMTKAQIQALMSDIMENIVYGNDFPLTQQKYSVERIPVKSPMSYKERKIKWQQKVGEV